MKVNAGVNLNLKQRKIFPGKIFSLTAVKFPNISRQVVNLYHTAISVGHLITRSQWLFSEKSLCAEQALTSWSRKVGSL